MTDLAGKVIVVTGARGMLGKAAVQAFREACAIVVALDNSDLNPTEDDRFVWQMKADVTVARQLSWARDRIKALHGTPHGLVCLHGLDAKPQNENDCDPWHDWQRMVDVNLTGTALACEVFGTAMAQAGRGAIVLAASLYSVVAPDQRIYPGDFVKPAAYSASKAGVVGLTKYLAALWGQFNVTVNAISLGGVGTPDTPADFKKRYESRVPLGRMATADDFNDAAVYLLNAGYVTGHNLIVDGGFSTL